MRIRCQTRSPSETSNDLPFARSHTAISGRENSGLEVVPPTGWGKSSWRRRQLLTAALPTPASLAMSPAFTVISWLSSMVGHSS